MSGTSTDGVDAVIARFSERQTCQIVASASMTFDTPLRQRLLALQLLDPADSSSHVTDRLLETELAINALSDVYAACAIQAMEALSPGDRALVRAAGAHGQTLRHRPDLGVTLQRFNPARFHALTGVTVVSDFRSADVAVGGQGAPLVPAFHRWWLQGLDSDLHQGSTAVVNIGGFANISCIHADGSVTGSDCGPGNVLMDAWAELHIGQPYDRAGAWAAKGQVHAPLLQSLLAHPFFQRPLPRSTGRDEFHLEGLRTVLADFAGLSPVDVQATLIALTVAGIKAAVPADCRLVLVCGGGAFNDALLGLLGSALGSCQVQTSLQLGVAPDQMEALAFAWLARQRLCGWAGNLPQVTGARQAVLLGAVTGL